MHIQGTEQSLTRFSRGHDLISFSGTATPSNHLAPYSMGVDLNQGSEMVDVMFIAIYVHQPLLRWLHIDIHSHLATVTLSLL